MNINEIFLSIQGESTFSGIPCIFIRFCNCNLNCNYCDTKYHNEINLSLNPDEIIAYLKRYSPVKIIELTGGEPLLQTELIALINLLIKHKYTILIETNGSQDLKQIPSIVHKIIDVKCPDSGEGHSFLPANLNYFNLYYDNLKFVISSENDYNFAKEFLAKYNIFGSNILFSTVLDKIEPKTIAEWIIRDKLNVRFQLQLHKYIWDPNLRGV